MHVSVPSDAPRTIMDAFDALKAAALKGDRYPEHDAKNVGNLTQNQLEYVIPMFERWRAGQK